MDEVTKQVQELKGVVQSEIKEVEAKAATIAKEAVQEAVEPIQTVLNEIKEKGAKVQEQMDHISTEMAKGALKTERVVSKAKTVFNALKENETKLKGIMNGERGGAFRIEVKEFVMKDAADMSIADAVDGDVPQAERIAGLNLVPTRPLSLLDIAQFRNTNSNVVSWVYQLNQEGEAGPTAEGSAKNQISFEVKVGSNKVEKVTAYIRVTDEMLEDIDFMASEINNELTRKLLLSVEDQAFRGDGNTPNLEGIMEVATAFAAGDAAGTVTNPNAIDVIDAAKVQIMEANQSVANYVMMNPYDVLKLRTAKVDNSDRNDYAYRAGLIVENGRTFIAGLPVIETFLVDAGEFLVGDFTKFHIAQKKGLTIEVGYNGDDFVENFKTIRCEWRGVAYVKHNDRTAFVAGDFATAITALQAT